MILYHVAVVSSLLGASLSVGSLLYLRFRDTTFRSERASDLWAESVQRRESLEELGILEIKPRTSKVKTNLEQLHDQVIQLQELERVYVTAFPDFARGERLAKRRRRLEAAFEDITLEIMNIERLAGEVSEEDS